MPWKHIIGCRWNWMGVHAKAEFFTHIKVHQMGIHAGIQNIQEIQCRGKYISDLEVPPVKIHGPFQHGCGMPGEIIDGIGVSVYPGNPGLPPLPVFGTVHVQKIIQGSKPGIYNGNFPVFLIIDLSHSGQGS